MPTKWSMQGTLLGACSCDWGCPCSFDAPPTRGFCQSTYLWHIEDGRFGEVPLAGLNWSWSGHSPGAMHQGNVTTVLLIDEKADAKQRQALTTIAAGKSGGPWTIFTAVTSKLFGPHFARFEMHLDGLNSNARAGEMLEMELSPILNPVTGVPEEIYVDKPTGFTSRRLTLGASRVFRFNSDIGYDHSGKYAEYSKFSYSGEAPE